VGKRSTFDIAFAAVSAEVGYNVVIHIIEIHGGGSSRLDTRLRAAVIDYAGIAGDNIKRGENAVIQLHGDIAYIVRKGYDKRFAAVLRRCIRGGKPGDRRLALDNIVFLHT